MANEHIKINAVSVPETGKKRVSVEFELDIDFGMIEKTNLGKQRQTCKVCGAEGEFQTWLCIDYYVGTREGFRYFECPECECLQIEEFPEDMRKHYFSSYYSFRPVEIEPVIPGVGRDVRMILDVGCGTGYWLCWLASIGCVNLYGCDPFIEKDITYSNGVKIKKCAIHEMEGLYDVIHLSHSLEHMPDPHEVFQSLDRLLKKGRGVYGDKPKVEIAIPMFPNLVFDIYGSYWYQLDPPRHFFLHSVKSLNILADEAGFKVESVQRQRNPLHYTISRMYQADVPISGSDKVKNNDPQYAFMKEQEEMFDPLSQFAVMAERTDIAQFTLVRK